MNNIQYARFLNIVQGMIDAYDTPNARELQRSLINTRTEMVYYLKRQGKDVKYERVFTVTDRKS